MKNNQRNKITKVAFDVLKKYKSRVEMINMLHNIGVSKHECMILELALLGKDYESIQRTLLFTELSFNNLLDSLYVSLKEHDKRVKLFKKLKGV